MSSTRHEDLRLLEDQLLRVFRALMSLTAGLVLGVVVVLVVQGGLSHRDTDMLVGFVCGLLYGFLRYVIRAWISKVLERAISITMGVAFVLAVGYVTLALGSDLTNGNRLLNALFGLFIGLWFASSVSIEDDGAGLLRRVRAGWDWIKGRLSAWPPTSETTAFACAVLLSILLNVPHLRPGLQFGLAGASAIVTLSLGWYAHLAAPLDQRTHI